MQEVIKIFCLLVAVSATSKFSDELYARRRLHIFNCFMILVAVYFFNSVWYVPVLIGSLVVCYIYIKLLNKITYKVELAKTESIKKELDTYKSLAGMYITKYEDLEQQIARQFSDIDAYKNSLAILVDGMYSMYRSGTLEENLGEALEEIGDLVKQPIMLMPDKDLKMFEELNTKSDYMFASKAIKRFRQRYFFGEAFNRELEFYEKLLEEEGRNVGNRVYKK